MRINTKPANVRNVTGERTTERASGCGRVGLRDNIPGWSRKKARGMSTDDNGGMVDTTRNYGTRKPSRAPSPKAP